jgi:hypothetical protein
MKRLLVFLALIIGLTPATSWSFDRVCSGIITSSGTTVIPLKFRTNEIFFERVSTGTAYINLTSSSVSTSDRLLRPGVVVSDTVEMNTTQASVFTSDLNFYLIWEARGWVSPHE